MTGREFRDLLVGKWGKPYDVQLRRVQERVVLLVMWKFVGQASFPWTEEEYLEHLERLAAHLREWGVWEQVMQGIEETRQRPRQGKAVTIPLSLGERASEWLL
ncbi:MAG: DUF3067 family protein [Thermostichales cyanobacterium BF3_bins_165]